MRIMSPIKEQLAALYLDYFNNYLTHAKFAEHNGLTLYDTGRLLDLGKAYHQEMVEHDQRRNNSFSGATPDVGSFQARIDRTGDDWCIFMLMLDGQRRERYCSTWQNEPCNGLTRVYEILSENGFKVG